MFLPICMILKESIEFQNSLQYSNYIILLIDQQKSIFGIKKILSESLIDCRIIYLYFLDQLEIYVYFPFTNAYSLKENTLLMGPCLIVKFCNQRNSHDDAECTC